MRGRLSCRIARLVARTFLLRNNVEHHLLQILRVEGDVSHSVDCGAGHFFCWSCLGEAHAPVPCHKYQEWLVRCARIDPEELHTSCQKVKHGLHHPLSCIFC